MKLIGEPSFYRLAIRNATSVYNLTLVFRFKHESSSVLVFVYINALFLKEDVTGTKRMQDDYELIKNSYKVFDQISPCNNSDFYCTQRTQDLFDLTQLDVSNIIYDAKTIWWM